MKDDALSIKHALPDFARLGLVLGSMMTFAPVLRPFGVAAVAVGVGIALFLRNRDTHSLQLNIDSVPLQSDVDAVIAKYDQEMDEFVKRNSRHHAS